MIVGLRGISGTGLRLELVVMRGEMVRFVLEHDCEKNNILLGFMKHERARLNSMRRI